MPARFAVPVVWTCRPTAVLFPRVGGTARSALTLMRREEAYRALAAGVLLTHTEYVRAQLDACATLVRACPSYRLEAGHHLEELVALVGRVVA